MCSRLKNILYYNTAVFFSSSLSPPVNESRKASEFPNNNFHCLITKIMTFVDVKGSGCWRRTACKGCTQIQMVIVGRRKYLLVIHHHVSPFSMEWPIVRCQPCTFFVQYLFQPKKNCLLCQKINHNKDCANTFGDRYVGR